MNRDYNAFCTADMGGDQSSYVIDGIPQAQNKTFRSEKALAVIKTNTDEVVRGRDSFNARFEEGKIKISKIKLTGLNRETLKNTLETMNEWDKEKQRFEGFNVSLKLISRELSVFETDCVEDILSNGDETRFLHLNIIKTSDQQKYELAACFVKSTIPINPGIMVGSLIKDGLLGKDEHGNLYLQI